eukprot:TRINITY_DN12826_c0_g1_i1.p1 TRINITY_DN12826_c0_g1~~TRINITY_DN12826_c0_g1_i1.p1  ORF type:complete len:248 (-),score=67.49 TRINITY_DN12826_c0_g1_i1:35-778(-)
MARVKGRAEMARVKGRATIARVKAQGVKRDSIDVVDDDDDDAASAREDEAASMILSNKDRPSLETIDASCQFPETMQNISNTIQSSFSSQTTSSSPINTKHALPPPSMTPEQIEDLVKKLALLTSSLAEKSHENVLLKQKITSMRLMDKHELQQTNTSDNKNSPPKPPRRLEPASPTSSSPSSSPSTSSRPSWSSSTSSSSSSAKYPIAAVHEATSREMRGHGIKSSPPSLPPIGSRLPNNNNNGKV